MGGRSGLLRQIDALFNAGALGDLPDAELLRRFVTARGEDAERSFEALVERHGPMVMAVCRRTLRDTADAQDAFQATFLVLARKAGRIGRPERLASWLYGVASRSARKARAGIARRRKHERVRAESVAEGNQAEDDAEIRALLHEEIARLPEKYRAPVILCHLEGMTRERASAQLNCPVGTVGVRLMRARERLRAGLARRGFAVAAGALAVDLGADSSPAGVPSGLAAASARAGAAALQGWKAASGSAPARAVGLARGVLTTMSWNRIAGLAGPAALLAGALALAARGDTPVAPARVATAPPQTERGATRWKKTLPGNAWTIELVGVGRQPWETGKPPGEPAWSTPDGRPLAAPAEMMTIVPTSEIREVRNVTFAFRVTLPGLKEDRDRASPGTGLVLDELGLKQSGVAGLLGVDPRDRDVCGFWAAYPKGTRTATVRLGAAVGAWRTVATSDGKAPSPLVTDAGSALFSAARATREGVTLNVAYLPTEPRAMRVVAIDSEGREIAPSSTSIMGRVIGPALIESEFPGPPGRVRVFRLQERSYEWAEFRNVALDPNR